MHHSLYIIDFFAVPTITPVVIGCGLGFDRHQDFLRSCSQAGTRTPTVVDSETTVPLAMTVDEAGSRVLSPCAVLIGTLPRCRDSRRLAVFKERRGRVLHFLLLRPLLSVYPRITVYQSVLIGRYLL